MVVYPQIELQYNGMISADFILNNWLKEAQHFLKHDKRSAH